MADFAQASYLVIADRGTLVLAARSMAGYALDAGRDALVFDSRPVAGYEATRPSAGPGDIDPPTVAVSTPTALSSRSAPVTFEVGDSSELARVVVAARFAALARTELVYDGTLFHAPYLGSSEAGASFTIRRAGGWPASFDLEVTAVDAEGNAF